MWRALEPWHAVSYFAPEPIEACAAWGMKGFWPSYFAQRAAPLGAVPAELVAAVFYHFRPAFVARAVPTVWAVATPQQFLDLRLRTVDAALHRLVGADVLASPAVAEAAVIARAAALAAPIAGRALGAANAALPWPTAPHLVLWHAQTILREQRGDGHVAALLTAGLDPLEALVLFAADAALDADWMRERRGWLPEEWAAARHRLLGRGLLAADALTSPGRDTLTARGKAVRAAVEAHTDALADPPWAAIGDARAERLVALVGPLVQAVVDGDGISVVNPMGLTPLGSGPSAPDPLAADPV